MKHFRLSPVYPPNAAWKQEQMAEDPPPEKGSKMPNTATAFDPVAAALLQLHQAVASEEVPEDFLRILDDIDAKIAAARSASEQ